MNQRLAQRTSTSFNDQNPSVANDLSDHNASDRPPHLPPYSSPISLCPHPLLLGSASHHHSPLCKLNPFYEEVVMLRFRALTDLSNVWQEDISQYV